LPSVSLIAPNAATVIKSMVCSGYKPALNVLETHFQETHRQSKYGKKSDQ
jgi:hypothetical protein